MRAQLTPIARFVAPLPRITAYAASLTSTAISVSSSAVKGACSPRQSRMGTGPILAFGHSGNSVSPCSPTMSACTLAVLTPARSARRQRRREVSSTVPDPKIRDAGRPVARCATTVMTSAGFVTMRNTASGACSTSIGMSDSMIAAFVAASSMRVCPGFCFAPAVTTMTSLPSMTAGSEPPLTDGPVNCVPWERSSTSASTFSWAMSNRATSPALPRMSAGA